MASQPPIDRGGREFFRGGIPEVVAVQDLGQAPPQTCGVPVCGSLDQLKVHHSGQVIGPNTRTMKHQNPCGLDILYCGILSNTVQCFAIVTSTPRPRVGVLVCECWCVCVRVCGWVCGCVVCGVCGCGGVCVWVCGGVGVLA